MLTMLQKPLYYRHSLHVIILYWYLWFLECGSHTLWVDKNLHNDKERFMAAKKAAKNATPTKAKVKKVTKKSAPARKMTALKEPMTKAVMISELSENTGLNKKQVNSVIDELAIVIERHIKKRAAGKFILPGLMKIQVKKKPATKARKGINPFTGEPTTFKAKPARRVVKVSALKRLKEMVG